MDKPVDDINADRLDKMEGRALLATVAEARACTAPDVPHEAFEREAEQERAELLKKVAAHLAE